MSRIGQLRRFLPKTRMGIFTAILVALWLLKTFLVSPLIGRSLGAGQQFSLDLLTLLLVVPAVYYAVRLSRTVRAKLLWKIRRRLILAHIFIGAIPVLLVLVIVYVSALLCYYQLSYYLISNQIGIHSGHVQAFSQALRAGLEQESGPGGVDPGAVSRLVDAESNAILAAYPSASVIVRVQDDGRRRTFAVGNRNVRKDLLADYRLPAWLGMQEFSGLVLERRQPSYYTSSLQEGADRRRARLYLRGTAVSEPAPAITVSVEVSVPFDRYMLDRLKAAVGLEMLLADHVPLSGLSVILQNTGLLRENVLSSTSDVDLDGQSLGRPVWSVLLFPVSWDTGEDAPAGEADVLFVELSTTRLFQNLFRSESSVSRTILGVLQVVIGFFVVVEVVSLVVGVLLTKSITTAVYNLDRGTEFIKRGDFSHRVVVRSRDQLGTLAASFNQMTEYIQALVKERVQKERLERELEIAKEVQEQLFPRRAPRLRRMEFSGLCLPARVVSGDYYDFLILGPERIGMAVGDICGKGISAALLMANLQATLRTNVANLARENGGAKSEESAVAEVVRLLNDHIYNYTSANKFASVFYGVYDDIGCRLTYCNAGHNPPLFLSNGSIRRLETGGTVVGIFPDADFLQETIEFQSGDVFVAYTDGIVESVNEYGEEFGEERLIELLRARQSRSVEEIQQSIVDAVLDWAYEEERDDDMTLIIAKVN